MINTSCTYENKCDPSIQSDHKSTDGPVYGLGAGRMQGIASVYISLDPSDTGNSTPVVHGWLFKLGRGDVTGDLKKGAIEKEKKSGSITMPQ